LTATPELARTVGREGTTIEEVCASGLPDEARRALETDSQAIAILESAGLGEPVETESTTGLTLARLPSATGSEPESRWRESLRRFHYENHVLGVESESHTANPLRPTILDARALAADNDAMPHEDEATLLEAWSSTVLEDRRRRQADLEAEIASLSRSLREILGLSEEQGAADGLAATPGRDGANLVDAGALQQSMSERGRTRDLSPSREQRLVTTLEQLERIGKRWASGPVGFVIHPEGSPPRVARYDVEVLCHTQGPSVAVGLFDGLAHEAVALSRALRTAKLEVGGRFDEARHGPSLERLDWQSLTPDELLRMPVVAVLETARHLRGPALGAFSELIRAGRPIHVLVEENIADLAAEILEPPFGYQPGLGYLAVAHREALVVQSSLCRAGHLGAGLHRLVTALDPAIVIVATPSSVLPVSSATQLEAALQARTTPLFVYDPSGGTTWSERFTLEGNPQLERPWPVYSVAYESDQGDEQTLDLAFTPAHSAAIDPAWRTHFRVIGPEAWLDDQIEIGEYLRLTDGERSKLLPYLWVVEDGKWARAILSWELAFACRDRARAWRILQELGGTDNAYARRAADEARRVAEEEFDQKLEKQQADFAVAIESARSTAAAGAIERLIGLLADPQGLQAAIAASIQASGAATIPVAQPTVALDAPPPAIEPAPSQPVDTELILEPYIDSFLCTTCNDCIDMNPRMFRYNADKQAEIANPGAGTFKELVKAAEACPARCIHPGAPRGGDDTATPALIERAAKFR
jgi:ferredoxin